MMTRTQKRIIDAINSGFTLRQSPLSFKKYGLYGNRRMPGGFLIAEFEVRASTVDEMRRSGILVVGVRPGGCITELLPAEALGATT